MIGSDIIGADTPQELTAKYNAEVAKLKAAEKPGVSFLQREAFGGMKVWQVGTIAIGSTMILGGLVTLIVRRK